MKDSTLILAILAAEFCIFGVVLVSEYEVAGILLECIGLVLFGLYIKRLVQDSNE